MKRVLEIAIASFLLSMMTCGGSQAKQEMSLAPVPLSNIVYPCPHPHWPQVEVYWNYDMTVEIFQQSETDQHINLDGLQRIRVRVDGAHKQRSRQDVYTKSEVEERSGEWDLRHMVIADYRLSTIME